MADVQQSDRPRKRLTYADGHKRTTRKSDSSICALVRQRRTTYSCLLSMRLSYTCLAGRRTVIYDLCGPGALHPDDRQCSLLRRPAVNFLMLIAEYTSTARCICSLQSEQLPARSIARSSAGGRIMRRLRCKKSCCRSSLPTGLRLAGLSG